MNYSLIIITSGKSQFLNNLIDSIQAQNNVNKNWEYEVIIVSNLKKVYKSCKLIYSPEFKGYSHACNLGAEYAKGDFLFFLNDDMLFSKKFFENITNSIKNDSSNQKNIYAPMLLNDDGSIQVSVFKTFTTNLTVILTRNRIIHKIINILLRPFNYKMFLWGFTTVFNKSFDSFNHCMGAAIIVSKEMFEKVKGFDENIFLTFEDQLFCKRVIENNGKVIYLKNALIIHYGHDTIKNLNSFNNHFKKSLNYFLSK